ncbi:MAG TPA: branched-chain amino acid ABC transporter substrate-binding protein [Ilumatobacter sp.]|nr:branched-chain amino acid ABC transporter substrate-binding protein [Ilumatobacter sp.]
MIGEGAPVVVAVSAPITGPDARTGTEDRDAVIAAVARWKEDNGATIKGHEIEVLAEDDGCTEADIAAEAARRLASQPTVVGVVGPNCSAGAPASLQIYADAGITSISGSATQSDLTTNQPPGGFFFRTAYRNDLVGSLIGLFVSLDLDARTAYLIDDNESYGQDLADRAQPIMERNEVTVTRVGIERGTVDFRAVAQQIVGDDPDVVGFMGFNPEAALLYRQLRDAGFDGVFGAGDAAATPEFIEGAGDASEGVLFAGCQLPLPDAFVTELEAIHEHQPGTSAFTAQQADATTILLNAIVDVAEEQADGSLVIEPTELRDSVRTLGLQNGLSGSFTFDANGDRIPLDGAPLPEVVNEALATQDLDALADLGLVLCQVQGGELVNLTGPGAQPMTTDGP